ncbi:DUF4097 family beta strand repeat protein [Streptomyces sp. TRM66268-LWL]|uniref:DUF4097 family beta strand repeat protein n=1 Tax=Streptomyces polyasparticus TaxID=2767826 RepID=A0ABR7SVA8_9ACTN|nr:DUF4097 family beta strand repeat-containing protein [Streptomyces polyasparticus]MBC9718288.1 DUF4097 family beta strand repeat protein [Streptomyces polyasparticus]
MHTFDTPAPISAVLDIPAGHVQFIAADRADTTVEVRPQSASSSKDAKAAENVTVAFADGVLRIESEAAKNRVLGNSGAVQITVQLPAGSRIDAKAASSELRGVGRLGDVTFEGAHGTVKLDETGAAKLTLQAGDVTVGRLAGPAEISTQKGDIRIAEAVSGAFDLRTEHGDISLTAAPAASATLDAATAYGRIDNALKNAADTPTLTIKATTSYGNITAQAG